MFLAWLLPVLKPTMPLCRTSTRAGTLPLPPRMSSPNKPPRLVSLAHTPRFPLTEAQRIAYDHRMASRLTHVHEPNE
jgi:hypothetical protein